MMNCINMYNEYGKGMGLPSMKEFFCPAPYDGMDKIIKYLKSGRKTFACTRSAIDAFSGEQIDGELCGMTDGVFSWMSSLAYYVEKYNLKLPEDFERHVFNQQK